MFDGLKPWSAKIIALALGIIFFILGTTWLNDFDLTYISKAVIMITIAIVLALELGLKLVTSLSGLKKMGLQQYLSLAFVLFLVVGAVLTLANIDAGNSINSINNLLISVGSIFIVVEAFN